jgi:tetratricopeptide (TPR) repeat protein
MNDADPSLAQALEHHQAGRHDEAEALYRRALASDPDEPTALYLYGLLNFETGRVDVAAGLLGRVVAARPNHVEARLTLANLNYWRGDHAAAIEGYRAVIARRPDDVAAHISLAGALRDRGDVEPALAAIHAALAIDPQSAAAYDSLGGLLTRMGQAEAAIDSYRAATLLRPDLASTQVALALALLGDARADEALAAADAALAADEALGEAWFARGTALMALQRPLEAATALEQAVARDPNQASAHLNLGNLYGELERGAEAIHHLRTAVELDPMAKEAHASLGSLYLLTGQKEEAERFCWLALAIDPEMTAPHQNLASLFAERGETDKAHHHRDAAYRRQNLFVEPAAAPAARVLILSTAESGNIPFKFLLPRDRYTRINWVIEYAAKDQATHLPAYDLVFNAIGDPDLAGPTAAPVARFLSGCDKPVFNDPARIQHTFRHLMPGLFADLADVDAPRAVRFSTRDAPRSELAGQIAAAGLRWPLLVRPIGSHGGKGLLRLDGPDDLAAADLGHGQDFYVTEYRDYRSADGCWRKYRVIFVDRRPYPYHSAIADNWLVHYESAEMPDDPARLAEELRFLEDPELALGAKAMAAVAAIGRRLDLDYCGVDFSVLADGSVLVFEANATMLVHPETEDSPMAFKNRYVQRILDAFSTMITPHRPD